MKFALTLFAYFIVLTCTLASRQTPYSRRGSRRSSEPGDAGNGNSRRIFSDIIDIDAAHDDGDLAVTGSGTGAEGDTEEGDDMEEGSGIDEGSGEGTLPTQLMLTLCQEQRQRLVAVGDGSRRLVGAFIPRCAEDGSYELLQCHASTGHCWCVDPAEGREVDGSRQQAPNKPDCTAIATQPHQSTTSFVTRWRPSTARPTQTTVTPSTSFGRVPTSDIYNKIDQMPNEPDIKFEDPSDTDSNYVERPVSVVEPRSRKMSLRASVIGQPGILAAIIGGAVVVLLCLVLLVMFIVYRMHRKSQDPAIYYIDKSARTPLAGAASYATAPPPSVAYGSSRKPGGYMKAVDSDVYG